MNRILNQLPIISSFVDVFNSPVNTVEKRKQIDIQKTIKSISINDIDSLLENGVADKNKIKNNQLFGAGIANISF